MPNQETDNSTINFTYNIPESSAWSTGSYTTSNDGDIFLREELFEEYDDDEDEEFVDIAPPIVDTNIKIKGHPTRRFRSRTHNPKDFLSENDYCCTIKE